MRIYFTLLPTWKQFNGRVPDEETFDLFSKAEVAAKDYLNNHPLPGQVWIVDQYGAKIKLCKALAVEK